MENESFNDLDDPQLSQQIISSIITRINEIGILIKDFNLNLNQNKQIKETIALLATIRLNSKAISTKLMSLLLPLSIKSLALPDKLFDSVSFLAIKYVDILNLNRDFLDQNEIADIMRGLFLFYSKSGTDSAEFIASKSKYIESILKLIYSQIDNCNFDFKTHFNNLIDFAIFIQMNSAINKRLSYMPGIVSKIVKSITVHEVKLTSKLLKKMLWILNDFLSNVLENLSQDDDNRIQFFNFYFCFMDALRAKYMNKVPKLLNELIETNSKLLMTAKKQKDIISINQFESLFNLVNSSLLDSDNNNNKEVFYYSCSVFFNKSDCKKRLIQEMNEMKTAYNRNESERFNKSSYVLSGLILIYINHCKSVSSEELNSMLNRNNDGNLDTLTNILNMSPMEQPSEDKISARNIYDELFNLFDTIIKCNAKIIYEVINQYEVSIKKVTNEDCEKKITTSLHKSIIYSNELTYNLSLVINIVHNQLYPDCPLVYSYLINKAFQYVFSNTKTFIASLSKQNTTRKQLNTLLSQALDALALFTFLTDISFKNELVIKAPMQYKAIISFFSSYLCDNDTIESLEKAKTSNSQITLINFFTIILCINGLSSPSISFNKQEKNALIMISMLNYSSKLSILKYSSTWLIFLLSNDRDVKQFIVQNFNLIINTILNKVIYFSSELSNAKVNIFNFFSSLIELIRDIKMEEMDNYYCGEFTKYIQYMFPYIDSNMKNKAFAVIEIMIEVISKITLYQNTIMLELYKEFEIKSPNEATKMALENNNTEYFGMFLKGKFSYEMNSNIFRQCILRIAPLLLSGQIKLVSKSIGIISNLVPLLHLLPMKREENENFSPEDPNNVIINSSLGPVMYEIWREIVYAFECQGKRKDLTTISDFKLFYSLFIQIMTYHPRFYSYERMQENLIPAAVKVFNTFEKIYSSHQYAKVITDFVFEFISRVSFVNHYGSRAAKNISDFIEKYKHCYHISNPNDMNIDDNIRIILSYYN